jgi:hypothetical protein
MAERCGLRAGGRREVDAARFAAAEFAPLTTMKESK